MLRRYAGTGDADRAGSSDVPGILDQTSEASRSVASQPASAAVAPHRPAASALAKLSAISTASATAWASAAMRAGASADEGALREASGVRAFLVRRVITSVLSVLAFGGHTVGAPCPSPSRRRSRGAGAGSLDSARGVRSTVLWSSAMAGAILPDVVGSRRPSSDGASRHRDRPVRVAAAGTAPPLHDDGSRTGKFCRSPSPRRAGPANAIHTDRPAKRRRVETIRPAFFTGRASR